METYVYRAELDKKMIELNNHISWLMNIFTGIILSYLFFICSTKSKYISKNILVLLLSYNIATCCFIKMLVIKFQYKIHNSLMLTSETETTINELHNAV